MWSTVTAAVLLLWDWLPQITVLLKSLTALTGLAAAVPPLVRRARRPVRPRGDR
ncbi:hypothetical protein [Streptomyces sp. NPDC093094]|uniref:hypothetical protein n=1 Tax=Streptomyces sp. NPDC093094 TaxID=3366026 RepID=UPI0037F6AC1B